MFRWITTALLIFPFYINAQDTFILNDKNCFERDGLTITFFNDYYPEGHQSGITIIQHGIRVAANGDLRLEASPGQWSPVPKPGKTIVDADNLMLSKTLWFPDSGRDGKGFNPIFYPDLTLKYKFSVKAVGQNSVKITIDLEEAIPESWVGKIGFNLELFPGDLFGLSYIMDEKTGIFPLQPFGEMVESEGGMISKPLASGKKLIIAPEKDLQRMLIETRENKLELLDGRSNHNNGWFIVRSRVPAGKTRNAIEWIITPNVEQDWNYPEIIQISQVGYHPVQKKIAVIEKDKRNEKALPYTLFKVGETGRVVVREGMTSEWGKFLRYNYDQIDFSEINSPGIYQIQCGKAISHAFQISEDVYKNNTWQPGLEYFLPVQMCHMRVNEKYRVWHDRCHSDDALMAPLNHNHFDGYKQGAETLTHFEPLDHVPGLNQGGWHDAGDYDLRVESQARTVWLLALMKEEFNLNHDVTTINFEEKLVEIHEPDGKDDIIQQMEHGLHSILGGYHSMGRLYRGIIASDLRQYVMLGDAVSMTDNIAEIPAGPGRIYSDDTTRADDRWVFTENNSGRELEVAGCLAAASRVLRDENPKLSAESLKVALELFSNAKENKRNLRSRIFALTELILTTGSTEFKKEILLFKKDILSDVKSNGWMIGRLLNEMNDIQFNSDLTKAVESYQSGLKQQQKTDSPYGVPYKPNIWGAGWSIQKFGVDQYFFYKAWPTETGTEMFENALNFVMGVHPGINNSSFVSGVGSKSVTTAYGVNRADWSFIPGGVASGTALIRPDLPEMKIWPYFWQQTEYVMGGGATNFMFLVLAVDSLYK